MQSYKKILTFANSYKAKIVQYKIIFWKIAVFQLITKSKYKSVISKQQACFYRLAFILISNSYSDI